MQNIPKEQSRRITGKKGKVEAMSASSAFINNGYLIIEKTQKVYPHDVVPSSRPEMDCLLHENSTSKVFCFMFFGGG